MPFENIHGDKHSSLPYQQVIMTLEFTISAPQGRRWYTASETVRGTVSWTNKRSTVVSRISVWLEGVLETSIKPISGQETTFGTAKHTVCQFLYGQVSLRADTTCLGSHPLAVAVPFSDHSDEMSTYLRNWNILVQLPAEFPWHKP